MHFRGEIIIIQLFLRFLSTFIASLYVHVPHCSDDWYGLLFSQTSTAKKSNLVLCVFHPSSDLPWLGPFPYLGPKTAAASDPRQTKPQTTDKSFPVIPSHLPSYHTPSNMLWAKEALLQVRKLNACPLSLCVNCHLLFAD